MECAVRHKKNTYQVLDAIRQQKIDAGLQPFKLVKYFSFSSLGVILILTLVLSWIISNHARTVMLEQTEEYSVIFAENLNQQVFRRFVVLMAIRYGAITLSNPVQFESLDSIIREIIQGMNVESVTIYDSKVNIISYSTIRDNVGRRDVGGAEYQKALLGISNSRFIYSGSVLNLLPGTEPVSCRLKTYTPFRQVGPSGESSENIMGVIEIVKDLSSEYTAIIRLQASVLLASSTVMMLLFLILRTIVSRASKKLEQKVMERLQLEEKLNNSERLAHLGSMVATVSHEIKSPLGIIRSTAEILEKRIRNVAPGNEHLARIIKDETMRLNAIVIEFLDFARPQQVNLQVGNVNDILTKVIAFIAPKAAEQLVEVKTALDGNPTPVNLDAELLYRAFLNILVNGLQAMEGGGVLTVVSRPQKEGKGMEIEISDTGIGISEQKIEHIFNPFFTDKNKGTGLGLAITRNIIQIHNGEISVSSTEGRGSTFRIFLP